MALRTLPATPTAARGSIPARLTGPSFAADQRRLNVALSRHRSSLLMFGYIKTTQKSSENRDTVRAERDEGGYRVPNPTIMREVFEMVVKSGRVIELKGNRGIDPDSYWRELHGLDDDSDSD
ncbi:hypothetical protein FZEAL_9826 [Fusarium zealandicum]|uniref:DNA2/NAM7 helicase-like C-terminal domain-containing protein n=1 Tax=Fusarium zealandicum TaxID=1053134 RepID=A0A8H4U858_9HYPO|nr:hypothetical protein FZEAL_9826 [Fusarium zealandicum]